MDLKRRAYEFGEAAAELRHHCLFEAAAWISEQALAMDPTRQTEVTEEFCQGRRSALQKCDFSQTFTAGRNYFSQREYLRAAHCFDRSRPTRGTFMKYYARYKLETHQKRGLTLEFGDKQGGQEALLGEIDRTLMGAQIQDPFIYYLYGCMTTGQKSQDALIQSVNAFPINWDAWKALLKHVKSMENLEGIENRLTEHWMLQFFQIEVYVKLKQSRKALLLLKELQPMFPQSPFFYAALSKCMYYARQYDMALTSCVSLLKLDPYRTQDMDIYAVLLYISNKGVELAELARHFSSTKKFTPEACCVMGHHYSLKGSHEKAIEYFERAVRLDDDSLNARLFMAQEYIQTRNHSTALKVLQEVVDRDRSNAEAWHLMGRAHELGEALTLAEHAFTEACCLNPRIAEAWLSRGICNYKLGKLKLSEFCLIRAEKEGCPDGTAGVYREKLKKKLYPDAEAAVEEATKEKIIQ